MPEEGLWQAIILRAYGDAAGRARDIPSAAGKRAAMISARNWVDSSDFAEVCDFAGFSASRIKAMWPGR